MCRCVRLVFAALMFLCVLSSVVFAQSEVTVDSGYMQLQRFLDSLTSLQASFTQTVRDSRDQVIDTSKGTLLIKRPGQFRWNYEQPNAQIIVSNGERIWIYDSELAQVTINRLDLSLNGTPAQLLSGQNKIRDTFEVEHVEQRADLLLINLAPKSLNSDFKVVQFVLRKEQLMGLSLTDKLGQITQLHFSEVKNNPKLPESQFIFIPPKGVDVIDNSGKAAKAK